MRLRRWKIPTVRPVEPVLVLGVLASSISVGVGIQGVGHGGSARTFGIFLTLLGLIAVSLSGLRLLPGVVLQPRDGVVSVGLIIALVTLTTLTFIRNDQVPTRYESSLDGNDPVHAQCADDAHAAGVVVKTAPLLYEGRPHGSLQLVRSRYCGSYWARMTFDATLLPHVLNHRTTLIVKRQADGVEAEYDFVPVDQKVPVVWGNMVGGGTCVTASGSVSANAGGPVTAASIGCSR